MNDRRTRTFHAIIRQSSARDRTLAVERLAAVIETEMLALAGHTATAAVVIVASRRRVSSRTLWRWKALVTGENDDIGRIRWLLPRSFRRQSHPGHPPLHRDSEILSLEEVL